MADDAHRPVYRTWFVGHQVGVNQTPAARPKMPGEPSPGPPDALMAMIFLCCGGIQLDPPLP